MSSGAISPARAPASIDMLQTVMRPSIESARIAEPRYSMIEPMPPPVPMRAMIASTMSFAVTPRGSSPSTVTAIVPRLRLRQRLRGEHVLDLAGADAERQRAERAVRGRVAVAAHDRHARLREALLGPDHVHDALARRRPWGRGGCRTPRSSPRAPPSACAEIGSATGWWMSVGRDVVVHRRHGEVGAADRAAGQAQAVERLRRRDLVDEVEVDVEEVGLAVGAVDDVAVPHLLAERPGGRAGHGLILPGACFTARMASPDLRMGTAKGRWVVAAAVLGSGVAFLDGTVVNAALPAISRDLTPTSATSSGCSPATC